MAIKYLAGKRIEGLTADTKPPNAEEGSIYKDIETGEEFRMESTVWQPKPSGGANNLDQLTDVDTATDTPDDNDVLTYSASGSKWVPAAPPGAGGGEANTVTNVGTGEGTLAKAKVGVDIPLKSLKQGTDIVLTNNTNDVTIDTGSNVLTTSNTKTLTNKTFDADGTGNSITNIENADIKAAAGIAKSKLAALNIVNADVDASAAIVTSKLADSANFILKTLDNAFGTHYFDITKMTAPSNPGANDIRVYVDTSDTHLKIRNNAGTVIDLHTLGTGTVTASSTDTFTNKTFNADGTGNSITNIENADIKSAAGIVYSKLSLSNSILNADVNSSAAIAYSKLALTGSILNADINASAAIAYSKLALTGSIVNADVDASAAIAKSKLAALAIVNADVDAAAAIVTSKLADSANFILKTLDNAFGAHYQDFTKMTAPGNPGANDVRLYVDTADTHLKLKTSGGTVIDLHSAGGSGAPTGASYLTLGTDGTLSAERVLTAGTDIGFTDGGAGSTLTIAAGSNVLNTTNSKTVTTKTMDAKDNVFINLTPETFNMWKVSSTYYASNNRTGAITSNSSFATLINAVITSVTAGVPITIELMDGDFDLAAELTIATTRIGNITIKGQGMGKTNIVITSAWNGASSGAPAMRIGAFQTIAAGVTGTLTANCNAKAETCTMSTGDSAKFAVGDYVMLTSTANWSSAPDTITKKAEIHRVDAVNTGTGVVTFDVPVWDSYTTATTAVLYKLSNFLKNITLEGFTIKPGSGLTVTNGVVFCEIRAVDNLKIKDVEVIDPITNYGGCLNARTCLNSEITGCVIRMTAANTFNTQYGIVVGNCSQNVTVSNCFSYGRWEHPFEAGNSANGTDDRGVGRGINFTNCFASGSNTASFDTHGDAEMINFNNCTALGTTKTNGTIGFQIRSRKSVFNTCIAKGAKTKGFYIAGDADDCQLINCIADGCGNDGITLSDDYNGVKRTRIIGGSFINNGNHGIRIVTDCNYTSVIGANIQGSGDKGIYIADSDRHIITGCVINNNTNQGIYFDDSSAQSNSIISNNNIEGNGSGTIVFGSTTLTNATCYANAGVTNSNFPSSMDIRRNFVEIFDDFMGLASGNFIVLTTGTQSGVSASFATDDTNVFGFAQLDPGNTSTGRAGLYTGVTSSLFPIGSGLTTFIAKVKFPILSTSGQRYSAGFGFMDGVSLAASADAIMFLYDEVSSANWKVVTVSNSVSTGTVLASSTTVVADTWYELKIVINPAASSVAFYVNNTQVTNSPITSNIPTGVTRATGVGAYLLKSVGSTSRVSNVDYMGANVVLTTPRSI